MYSRDERTQTSAFGVGRREGHDASAFYARFTPPALSDDEHVNRPESLLEELGRGRIFHGSSTDMHQLPDSSVALVVTSPPYFVGKEYELAVTGEADADSRVPGTYLEFLDMLREVFAECTRVLEPGGRIAVNVANLGRKPYRSLSADVISILQDDLQLLLRGEVIWEKASTSSGSCAWGSFAKASNPVLRDMTERVIIASKGRFARALSLKDRRARGLPHESTLANDEFVDVTRDVWRIDAESATRVGHPAPFPVELPRRLIELYTYEGDLVLDPFLGSGSTLVAAVRSGRRGVGFDLDPAYVEVARQRVAAERAALGDPALAIDPAADAVAQAVDEGKKVADIAARVLGEAGFTLVASDVTLRDIGTQFAFSVQGSDGREWFVDVAGSFTNLRPGLQRPDVVWRTVAKAAALRSSRPDARLLVLTPCLPRRGSEADKALRAGARGAAVFDVVELYDPAGLARLEKYAGASVDGPLPGFWPDGDAPSAAARG